MNKISSDKQIACIRCGRCLRACPFNLMPTEIEKAYNRRDVESLKKLKVTLCMNCGCCTYVCPSKRKLAEINQLAKMIIPRN
jgi:electron transport complex protein RnfC